MMQVSCPVLRLALPVAATVVTPAVEAVGNV